MDFHPNIFLTFFLESVPCAQSKILIFGKGFFGIFLTREIQKKALKNVLTQIEQRKFEVA